MMRTTLVILMFTLAACGTVEGVGRDLETAGNTLSREARQAR